jgi:hypothetical protein
MAWDNSETDQVFDIEIDELDSRNSNEAALDRLLNKSMLAVDLSPDDRLGLGIEAVERYLQAVRRRNRLRRNWHPRLSQACDAQTLSFIKAGVLSKSVGKRLRESLCVEIDGKRYIPEELIPVIHDAILEDTRENTRGEGKHSLTKIIKAILVEKPNVTSEEVREIMDRNREDYGILAIDDDFIELQSIHGKKGSPRNSPPLSTASIPVILSRQRRKNGKTAQK